MSREPNLPDGLARLGVFLEAAAAQQCLDARDCRAPVPPTPFHALVGKR